MSKAMKNVKAIRQSMNSVMYISECDEVIYAYLNEPKNLTAAIINEHML